MHKFKWQNSDLPVLSKVCVLYYLSKSKVCNDKRYSERNPSQCQYLGNKKQDASEVNVQRAKKILNLRLNKTLIAYEFNLVAPASASFDFTELYSQRNN
jgi:hypothetical protein